MTLKEAHNLLQPAVPVTNAGSLWADFGAGTGFFTQALASLLDPAATIFALDRDANALEQLRASSLHPDAARIQTIVADLKDVSVWDNLPESPLNGVLFANSLHFIEAQDALLQDVIRHLQPDGRIILIEYDREVASRWVPYPISRNRLAVLAEQLPLTVPRFVASHPSSFGGQIYCAVLDKR